MSKQRASRCLFRATRHAPLSSPSRALRTAVTAGTIVPDFAYINAALVPGVRGLTLAAFAARAATLRGRARTRSPYTELVLAMSGGRNIGTALATFGLSPAARHLVVCRFDAEQSDGAAAAAAVDGTLAPLADLDSVRDEAAMRKVRVRAGEGCGWGAGFDRFLERRGVSNPRLFLTGLPHHRRRGGAPE